MQFMTTQIDNNVPIPTDEAPAAETAPETKSETKSEAPKKKHRARRAKTTAVNPAASLLAALKFVAVAQKKAGTVQQQFGMISGNWAAASNGVLTIATKVEEDLTACPHTYQLIDALSKVGEDLSITQLSPTSLAVVSGAFRALIPCAGFADVGITGPDERCAVIDDRIKAAFEAVLPLATDGAQHAHLAAVLLQSGSAVATNGHVLAEYWHGIDLPPMLIPKASAVAILKAGKALTGFGYSGSSATFWFEDDSFIKTQLFAEQFPNYQPLFNCKGLNPWPVPDEFYKAVRSIESFSRSGVVYFENGMLASNEQETEASTYKIEGLPEGMGFNAKYLLMVKSSFKNVHFDEDTNKAYFFGENVRGVLSGIDRNSATPHNAEASSEEDDNFPPF